MASNKWSSASLYSPSRGDALSKELELQTLTSWLASSLVWVSFGGAPAQLEVQKAEPPKGTTTAAPSQISAIRTALIQTTVEPTTITQQGAATLAQFEVYKSVLITRARAGGISEASISAFIPPLRLNTRAIQLDQAQRPVSSTSNAPLSFSPYLRAHVTPSLIARGQSRYYDHWPSLIRIYTIYGVDPAVIMAIYGKETSYGSVTGNFDLLEALASLAFDGRRREMFEAEFLATLKLIEAGTPRERLRGSYAGAMGYPQFMPSVALRLRADGDGDGIADIWGNEVDAMASIGNYLRDAGWKRGVPWGSSVRLPANFNRAAVRATDESPRCPAVYRRHSRWLPVSEWSKLGVVPLKQPLPAGELAALMESSEGGTAYLLTANYRAILAYNCSNYYAMSVALLADAIARR